MTDDTVFPFHDFPDPDQVTEAWWITSSRWNRWDTLYREDMFSLTVLETMTRRGAAAILAADDMSLVMWDTRNMDLSGVRTAVAAAAGRHVPTTLLFYCGGWSYISGVRPEHALAILEDIQDSGTVLTLPAMRIDRTERYRRGDPALRAARGSGPLRERFAGIWDKVLLFEQRGDQLVYSHIGQDALICRLLGWNWRRDTIGMPFDRAIPDSGFDRRISDTYNDVLTNDAQVTDRVYGPMALNGTRAWIDYDRVLCRVRDTERVTLVSYVTPRSSALPQAVRLRHRSL